MVGNEHSTSVPGAESGVRCPAPPLEELDQRAPGWLGRVLNAMGPESMSPVQGRNCAACSTELTAQTHNELLMQNFVMCKACGRILYLPG